MPFTGQVGTIDSRLGNIVLGFGESAAGAAADYPDLVVEMAFPTAPTVAPIWWDVSKDFLRAGGTQRGRNHELNRTEAGTATLLLDNLDRRFDPTNTAGPYYPYVKPRRRVRISARHNGSLYRLMTGYVEAWPQSWPGKMDAVVQLACVDGFSVLSRNKVTATFNDELTSTRVANVLDAAGWPYAERAIDEGRSFVRAADLAAEGALEHLQAVATAEGGRLYIRADGTLAFVNRHTPGIAPYNVSRAIFGDAPGELPYFDLVLTYDDQEIFNEVVAASEGRAEQVVRDAASQAEYWPQALSRAGPLLDDNEGDNDAYDSARVLLSIYKDPLARIESMVLKPRRDPALWAHALGAEQGDRVTIRRRPPGGGAAIEQDNLVEGIAHEFDASTRDWTTTFALSPTGIGHTPGPFWVLGDPALSLLGTSTRLTW